MYGVWYRREIPAAFRQKTEKEATTAEIGDDTESGISLSNDVGLIHLYRDHWLLLMNTTVYLYTAIHLLPSSRLLKKILLDGAT